MSVTKLARRIDSIQAILNSIEDEYNIETDDYIRHQLRNAYGTMTDVQKELERLWQIELELTEIF